MNDASVIGTPVVQPESIVTSAPVGPQVLRILRGRILRGELPPGARLSEGDVAGSYRVSRQPVREAFIRLAEESLVEIRPQRGTFVSRIRIDAVTAARFVREAVEADIVRIVARERSDAVVHALERLLEAQRRETEGPDTRPFLALDEQFHRRLAEAANQDAAWDVLQPLKTQMDRMRYLNARHFPREQLIVQHSDVVEAIRKRDADTAEAAMRGHLRQILDDLPVIAKALPDFFEPRGGGLE